VEALETPAVFQIPNFLPFLHGRFIPEHVAMAWLIILMVGGLAWLATRRLREVPGPLQNLFEIVVEQLGGLLEQNIGHGGRRFLPLIGAVGLFVLVGNLLGMVPGLKSPTANLNTNAALAVTVFVFYHAAGIREQGALAYLKHFAGPVWWLAPLMVPIELIGHLARPISLSIRLFGNIFGHEMIVLILFTAIFFLAPLPILFLGLFVAFVQTLVFLMLSMIYIAGATEGAHAEH
jgi:F-type H+-transporting ATPase subunit a